MRKSFKRIALLAALVLSAGMIMGQTTVNFTAAEIVAGTTKQGVSVRTSYNAVSSNKQICKEGSTATKATVLEIKNTPGSNLADTFYAEIKCSSGITGLEIHGSTNASDAADEVCVFWNTTSPTNQNIDGATLVNLAGYAGSCSSNNTSVNVPSGTQTIRLFRQLKKFDSATHAFSSSAGNYGSGKTFYIVDVTVTIAGGGGDNPPTPPTPSSDATLSDLKVDGTTISGFDANTTSYNYTIAAGVTTIPTVSATATNTNAQVAITQATSVTGQASVVVTAQDNSTTKTYTVQFSQSGGTDPPTPPTPPTPTDLTLHETEIYESPVIAGGYGATLSVFNNREYEVYYASFDNSNNLSVTTTPVQKSSGVTTSISQYKCKATDGWFEMETSTSKSNYTMTATDEFQAGSSAVHKLLNNAYYKFHIKGYDQFSFYGKDNKANESNGKHFEVYVDGVKQAMTLSESASIRRFDITTGEHVIEVRGVGASNNEFYGFSLRVAYVPKLKHLKGNDSTQVVYETSAIRPITYYLKNYVSDAELVWNGNEATGISLVKGNNDTLFVQGNANCSSGVYQYTIQAKDATNTVVSSLNGSFTVDKKIELSSGGLNITVFANSSIKPVVFRCYVVDMNEVSILWTTAAAPGLSFGRDAANHTVTLSGTPTQPGNYAYTVGLSGGNSLSGTILVKNDQPTVLPGKPTLLYLYKDVEDDALFSYISSSQKYGYFARPAADDMADNSTYAAYDAVIISENVDATNKEVLGIIRSLKKPVLNMKVFTYSSNRLGWGDPDNGSISKTAITLVQPQHPIFNGVGSNGTVQLLSAVGGNKGLMPAEVTYAGSMCLATAPKRGENYTDDGEAQTFIHEVPATKRGAKYLSLPIGTGSLEKLTADAKKLFDNMISYLTTSATSGVSLPTLQITALDADGVAGVIDEQKKVISLQMPKFAKLEAVKVNVTLADSHSFVTPASGSTVDLSDTHYGVTYTVSDYINVVKYQVKVLTSTDLENTDADGLTVNAHMLLNPQGVWVNIFSVSGQLITTTNSDFSFEGLPRGMYVIKGENSLIKMLH